MNILQQQIWDKWAASPKTPVILISGPYTHGAKNAQDRNKNLRRLNETALAVFEKGYLPVVAINLALPLVLINKDVEGRIMMPMALAIAARCDCALRVGGPSSGADDEIALMKSLGKPVYYGFDDLPAI